ncbi:hypothetical protein [Pseudoalteromonas nigrifaciens]|uniref:hypothetical protein n=1 Tax=Pseudoalteromonas nigrifaciens TaxID=28109 RepID=UPI00186649E5|nr:hypothetical protein [Pseudoalteromonas nigrifaciens]
MVSITQIPDGSKLMLIGDWFQNPGGDWQVVCYFNEPNGSYFRKSLPIDLLPALTVGKTYPLTEAVNHKTGFTSAFVLPKQDTWELVTYSDMPQSLQKKQLLKEFDGQIEHQLIYKIQLEEYIMWLPLSEFARMLLFQSAEIVRTLALEGNTYQLAKAEMNDWVGKVIFGSHVPLNFINSLEYRKFFAWLMFDDSAKKSFGSIFGLINSESKQTQNSRRWTFNFTPPNVENSSITWSGYTGLQIKGEGHHRYVNEIRSIAGVPTPELYEIEFEHPEDYINLDDDKNEDQNKKKKKYSEPATNPKKIDSSSSPRSKGKRYTININKAGFHFDTYLDLRRSPRNVRILPKGTEPELVENQEDNTVGIKQGKNTGKRPRADIDKLDKPEPIKSSAKLQLFEIMLETLAEESGWKLFVEKGNVPKVNCRSAHLVAGLPRQFCYAEIQLSEGFTIYAIEIELQTKETLSTLFYRSEASTYKQILNDLMSSNTERNQKAMQWDRKNIKKLTVSDFFLGHPDKKNLSEEEINQSWSARAKQKILTL